MLDDTESAMIQGARSGTFQAPTTFYTIGTKVGGRDETNDRWTNRGFSSSGKNLTPGIVAVGKGSFPIGTIFRDTQSGEAFIAGDKHGNADPNVIDRYADVKDYQRVKTNNTYEVVGRVAKVPITAEGVQSLLSKFGKVPKGLPASSYL